MVRLNLYMSDRLLLLQVTYNPSIFHSQFSQGAIFNLNETAFELYFKPQFFNPFAVPIGKPQIGVGTDIYKATTTIGGR